MLSRRFKNNVSPAKNMYEHHHQDFKKNPDQVRILHSIRFLASNWKPKVDKAVQRASSGEGAGVGGVLEMVRLQEDSIL